MHCTTSNTLHFQGTQKKSEYKRTSTHIFHSNVHYPSSQLFVHIVVLLLNASGTAFKLTSDLLDVRYTSVKRSLISDYAKVYVKNLHFYLIYEM